MNDNYEFDLIDQYDDLYDEDYDYLNESEDDDDDEDESEEKKKKIKRLVAAGAAVAGAAALYQHNNNMGNLYKKRLKNKWAYKDEKKKLGLNPLSRERRLARAEYRGNNAELNNRIAGRAAKLSRTKNINAKATTMNYNLNWNPFKALRMHEGYEYDPELIEAFNEGYNYVLEHMDEPDFDINDYDLFDFNEDTDYSYLLEKDDDDNEDYLLESDHEYYRKRRRKNRLLTALALGAAAAGAKYHYKRNYTYSGVKGQLRKNKHKFWFDTPINKLEINKYRDKKHELNQRLVGINRAAKRGKLFREDYEYDED